MKIIEYLHTATGGHMHYTKELVSALLEVGVDARILTGRDAEDGERTSAFVAVPDLTKRRGTPSWVLNRAVTYARQPRDVLSAIRVEATSGNDWVHLQQLPTFGAARMIRRLRSTGWNIVVTVHNVEPHDGSWLARRLHALQVRAWAEADVVLVHSARLVQPLRGLLPSGTQARIDIVPHPVWVEASRDDLIPTKEFLFFGHLRENKGVEDFVRSLSRLGDPRATIAGAGTAAEIASLDRALALARLGNCTVRKEFIPDDEVASLFGDHRVVVAPYRDFAAQSGVTHLAVAHRRPIVVTDVGGLADLVNDFKVGEIVAAHESLHDTMSRARSRAAEGVYDDAIENARVELHPVAVARKLVACLDGR